MLRPGNRSRAKANPARLARTTFDTITVPETISELPIASQKSTVSKTRRTFSKRCPPGRSSGDVSPIAELSLVDTTNDQYSGNMDAPSTPISRA